MSERASYGQARDLLVSFAGQCDQLFEMTGLPGLPATVSPCTGNQLSSGPVPCMNVEYAHSSELSETEKTVEGNSLLRLACHVPERGCAGDLLMRLQTDNILIIPRFRPTQPMQIRSDKREVVISSRFGGASVSGKTVDETQTIWVPPGSDPALIEGLYTVDMVSQLSKEKLQACINRALRLATVCIRHVAAV